MEIIRIVTGVLDENCYVIKQDGKCLIVDPGADSKKIKDEIADNKILAVLITHSHFDHIGALRDFLNDNRQLKIYKKSNLEDNEVKEIGPFTFQVLYTPGHSSDSISFYFEKENVMFTGDFIFRDTIGRCDLPTGSDLDMKKSLSKMKNYPNELKIYSGHGEETTLGREREKNFYIHE